MATRSFTFLIWQLTHAQTLGALKQRRGDVVGARDALRRSAKFGGGAPTYVAWATLEERNNRTAKARELFEMGAARERHNAALVSARANFEARSPAISRDLPRS